MRKIEGIPERLKAMFERMNLTPEEQEKRWQSALRRQSDRHDADAEYREWLETNGLVDTRYPAQMDAARMKMEYTDLAIVVVDEYALTLISASLIRQHNVFPWKFENNKLYLAVADLSPVETIRETVRFEVVPVFASAQAIQFRIAKHLAA
jgi:hypothetical protein